MEPRYIHEMLSIPTLRSLGTNSERVIVVISKNLPQSAVFCSNWFSKSFCPISPTYKDKHFSAFLLPALLNATQYLEVSVWLPLY